MDTTDTDSDQPDDSTYLLVTLPKNVAINIDRGGNNSENDIQVIEAGNFRAQEQINVAPPVEHEVVDIHVKKHENQSEESDREEASNKR